MIRQYSPNDKSKTIELLRRNTPEYFAVSEEVAFENYLTTEVEDYFVYEDHSEIIGAGGINYFPQKKLARISWDIIAPEHQGKGIGKKLLQHRIKHLNQNPNIEQIVVRTSQLVSHFYKKAGFELDRIEKDFWAKGYKYIK